MNILYEIVCKNVHTFMKKNIWTPRVFLIFFTFFERILYTSNRIIFIFSWCRAHTKIRSKLAVIVTAGSQKNHPLGSSEDPPPPLVYYGLKKEYSYTHTPPLCLMACFSANFFLNVCSLCQVLSAIYILLRQTVGWQWVMNCKKGGSSRGPVWGTTQKWPEETRENHKTPLSLSRCPI